MFLETQRYTSEFLHQIICCLTTAIQTVLKHTGDVHIFTCSTLTKRKPSTAIPTAGGLRPYHLTAHAEIQKPGSRRLLVSIVVNPTTQLCQLPSTCQIPHEIQTTPQCSMQSNRLVKAMHCNRRAGNKICELK